MKLRLLILLAAAALAAAPAAGQTIKSLGFNTSNGVVPTTALSNLPLTFTNIGGISGSSFDSGNVLIGSNTITFYGTNSGLAFLAGANASQVRNQIGLGATWLTNTDVTNFRTAIGGTTVGNAVFTAATTNAARTALGASIVGANIFTVPEQYQELYLRINADNTVSSLSPAATRTNLGLGATNAVTFSNITATGTLTATGNATLNGVNNTMPNATTADSASSLMTRGLSDDRYLGEFWNAWRMSAYNTTNIPVAVFKTAPCVLFTNGQSAFYVEAFLDPSKYAGKTVRVLAYCRVDSTNGGNVQGAGRILYLTNTAGGADPNFPLSSGGQVHGSVGVFTNVNTDVFPVATSTNQYLIFTSNVGTISNNATMIIATFGFNRATNISTFTNNLYMQGVQVVVE
jgi:hypothetical protein